MFFKKDNTVYTEKNFMVGNQRERYRKDELERNRKEFPEKLLQKLIDDRAEAKEREKEAQLTEEQVEEVNSGMKGNYLLLYELFGFIQPDF